jgi:hypothetical protein
VLTTPARFLPYVRTLKEAASAVNPLRSKPECTQGDCNALLHTLR